MLHLYDAFCGSRVPVYEKDVTKDRDGRCWRTSLMIVDAQGGIEPGNSSTSRQARAQQGHV